MLDGSLKPCQNTTGQTAIYAKCQIQSFLTANAIKAVWIVNMIQTGIFTKKEIDKTTARLTADPANDKASMLDGSLKVSKF